MRKLTQKEDLVICGGEGWFTYTDTCGIDGCQFSASATYYELFTLGLAALDVMKAIGAHRREAHPLKDREF